MASIHLVGLTIIYRFQRLQFWTASAPTIFRNGFWHRGMKNYPQKKLLLSKYDFALTRILLAQVAVLLCWWLVHGYIRRISEIHN